MNTMEYIKPEFRYWSSNELNEIEAKMSGGGYSGGSSSGGGSPGWSPSVTITNSEYYETSETLRIWYTVNTNIPVGKDVRIGYEYAGALNILHNIDLDNSKSVQRARGSYTLNLSVPNRLCEFRAVVGEARNGIFWKLYSSSKKHRFFREGTELLWDKTITKIQADTYSLMVAELSFCCEFVPFVGGGLSLAIGIIDVAGCFQQVFNVNLGIPTLYEGNYYRLTMCQTYYEWIFEFRMWRTKEAHDSGENSYYSDIVKLKVQVF